MVTRSVFDDVAINGQNLPISGVLNGFYGDRTGAVIFTLEPEPDLEAVLHTTLCLVYRLSAHDSGWGWDPSL